MRRIVLWGFVIGSVSLLCFFNVIPLERKLLNPDDGISTTTASAKPMTVEVTNFPATQSVAGTVSVGNLPAVQTVTGSVAVSNLTVDADGNLKVSCAGANAPISQLIELRFHESDRVLGRLPLIPLPSTFRTVAIFVQVTDATTATIRSWSAGFGSDTAPLVHYNIGDFQVFGSSFPLNLPSQTLYVPGDFSGLFNITGTHLQLLVNAEGFSSGLPPSGTEYYVSLYLSK